MANEFLQRRHYLLLSSILLLLGTSLLLVGKAEAQIPDSRKVIVSPDGGREVEVNAAGELKVTCTGCSAASVVDQGTSNDGTNPWYVRFIAAQHIICDTGCGTATSVLMADATANPTIPQSAAFGMLYNGVTWDRWRGGITTGALVNVSNASLAVTGTFWPTTAAAPSSTRLSDGAAFYDARSIRVLTFAGDKVDVSGSSVNQGAPPWSVVGNIASGSADSGNPLKIGGVFNTTPPTVATGQRVDLQTSSRGELLVLVNNTPAVTVTNSPTVVQGNAGTNPQAWWVRIGDSVNGPAAVKAGSQASVAGDASFVVALSPNSPVPTGTNSIGDVRSITTSIVPGTAATQLGKAEDAAHTSGDVGVAGLWVRKDSATQTTNADADYAIPAVDAYSAVFVRNDHPNRVQCRLTTAATVSTLITGCAAPGAGLAIYITDYMIYGGVATAVAAAATIQSGTGGACGTGTVINLYCQHLAQTGCNGNFTTPARAVTNGEVCLLDATAGTKFVVINGFIAP